MIKEIDREAFLDATSQYCSEKYGEDIRVIDQLSVIYGTLGARPDLRLFYYKTVDDKKVMFYMPSEEIDEALNQYASKNNCELKSYYFLGGVRRAGFFIDEDEPYFEGVRLHLREKGKQRLRKKRKRI